MLYAVSDVHGHRDDLVAGLREAGLVDGDERWCGGDSQLWLLGDFMDRGPDGIGVVDLVMSLQTAAPDNVHALMGNHEALALGMHRFPESRFGDSWLINGGRVRDQDALTERHLAWMRNLPVVGRTGPFLMAHSDILDYLAWGSTIEEVNQTVRKELDSGELDSYWGLWAALTGRYHFAGENGAAAARELLNAFGGECIVHGHSIIAMLTDVESEDVTGPVRYADGLALAIDGGRYDGGPLLVVRLE
jgi:hypothetical protein